MPSPLILVPRHESGQMLARRGFVAVPVVPEGDEDLLPG
jgi:hypothetical protein